MNRNVRVEFIIDCGVMMLGLWLGLVMGLVVKVLRLGMGLVGMVCKAIFVNSMQVSGGQWRISWGQWRSYTTLTL